MRIPKSWVSILATGIVKGLSEKKLIELKSSKDTVIKVTNELMSEELRTEDRINQEVRELLIQYDMEIERGRLDYHKLFELTKQKLIKERNIIL